MNYQLFSAFLLITVVLFLTPGPIVTLIIATGARQGTRAALATVAGATTGNALLVSLHRVRPGLDPENLGGGFRLSALGRRRLSGLSRRAGLAPRRRARPSG